MSFAVRVFMAANGAVSVHKRDKLGFRVIVRFRISWREVLGLQADSSRYADTSITVLKAVRNK